MLRVAVIDSRATLSAKFASEKTHEASSVQGLLCASRLLHRRRDCAESTTFSICGSMRIPDQPFDCLFGTFIDVLIIATDGSTVKLKLSLYVLYTIYYLT